MEHDLIGRNLINVTYQVFHLDLVLLLVLVLPEVRVHHAALEIHLDLEVLEGLVVLSVRQNRLTILSTFSSWSRSSYARLTIRSRFASRSRCTLGSR